MMNYLRYISSFRMAFLVVAAVHIPRFNSCLNKVFVLKVHNVMGIESML